MIYFVRPKGQSGPIKIGLADDAHRRLRALEANSPMRLELIATFDGGKDVECRFHEHFLPQQAHYEWFHWSSELQGMIDEIRAGAFDVACLKEAETPAPTQRGKPSFWSPDRRPWATAA